MIPSIDTGPAAPRPRRPAGRVTRMVSLVTGAGLVVAGVLVVGLPLLGVLERGRADANALAQWNHGATTGKAPGTGGAAECGAASGPAGSYALVTFPSLSQYGYAGVAGDGTWGLLLQRSMVHYQGSAAPGQLGNDIIAFHREPNFQNIDQLAVGDVVDVEDRSCSTWHYRVTQAWTLPPSQVTQLGPTKDAELTLITCTPWWQDYDRLVWRAVLTDVTTSTAPAPQVSVPVPNPVPQPTPASSPAGSVPTPAMTPAPALAPTATAPAPNPTPTPTPTSTSSTTTTASTTPTTTSTDTSTTTSTDTTTTTDATTTTTTDTSTATTTTTAPSSTPGPT